MDNADKNGPAEDDFSLTPPLLPKFDMVSKRFPSPVAPDDEKEKKNTTKESTNHTSSRKSSSGHHSKEHSLERRSKHETSSRDSDKKKSKYEDRKMSKDEKKSAKGDFVDRSSATRYKRSSGEKRSKYIASHSHKTSSRTNDFHTHKSENQSGQAPAANFGFSENPFSKEKKYIEIRLTRSLPAIEYSENGRYQKAAFVRASPKQSASFATDSETIRSHSKSVQPSTITVKLDKFDDSNSGDFRQFFVQDSVGRIDDESSSETDRGPTVEEPAADNRETATKIEDKKPIIDMFDEDTSPKAIKAIDMTPQHSPIMKMDMSPIPLEKSPRVVSKSSTPPLLIHQSSQGRMEISTPTKGASKPEMISTKKTGAPIEKLYTEYEQFLLSCENEIVSKGKNTPEGRSKSTIPLVPTGKDGLNSNQICDDKSVKLIKDNQPIVKNSTEGKNDQMYSSSSGSSPSSSSSSSSSVASSSTSSSSEHSPAETPPPNDSIVKLQSVPMLCDSWEMSNLAEEEELMSKAAELANTIAKKLGQKVSSQDQEKINNTTIGTDDWDMEPKSSSKSPDTGFESESVPEPETMLLMLQNRRPAISMKLQTNAPNLSPASKHQRGNNEEEDNDFTVKLAEKAKKDAVNNKSLRHKSPDSQARSGNHRNRSRSPRNRKSSPSTSRPNIRDSKSPRKDGRSSSSRNKNENDHRSSRRRSTSPSNRRTDSASKKHRPSRQSTPVSSSRHFNIRSTPSVSTSARSSESASSSARSRRSPKRRSRSRSPLSSTRRRFGSPAHKRWRPRTPSPSRPIQRSSHSPIGRSRSPIMRSRSPLLLSRSPISHSRSPKRQTGSPFRRSGTPLHCSRSPIRRSRSPIRRSRSPIRRSRSPQLRYRSPIAGMSRSPQQRRRSRSPLRRSRSPFGRLRSPLRRLRSLTRSPSPNRIRSKSPRPPRTPPHPAPSSPGLSPNRSPITWADQYRYDDFHDPYRSYHGQAPHNRAGSGSPKRMALDHRIARVLGGYEESMIDHQQNAYGKYQGGHCGPPLLDDESSFVYPDDPLPMNNHHTYSNLIEIKSAKDTPLPMSQFALQKGNVLEIVPKRNVQTNAESVQVVTAVPAVVPSPLSKEEQEKQDALRADQRNKRKQERDKIRLEKFMRKEKLKWELQALLEEELSLIGGQDDAANDDETVEDAAESTFIKASYNKHAPVGKSCLKLEESNEEHSSVVNHKKVLFSDGIRPGDGTSLSDSDDTTPLPLRDRNKKAMKKRLDSRQRRKLSKLKKFKKEKSAAVLSNAYGQDQVTKLVIDPELENMPPPAPPAGDPPSSLPQPTLKKEHIDESVPRLIYFHYSAKDNSMYVSSCPTPYPQKVQQQQQPSDDNNQHQSQFPLQQPQHPLQQPQHQLEQPQQQQFPPQPQPKLFPINQPLHTTPAALLIRPPPLTTPLLGPSPAASVSINPLIRRTTPTNRPILLPNSTHNNPSMAMNSPNSTNPYRYPTADHNKFSSATAWEPIAAPPPSALFRVRNHPELASGQTTPTDTKNPPPSVQSPRHQFPSKHQVPLHNPYPPPAVVGGVIGNTGSLNPPLLADPPLPLALQGHRRNSVVFGRPPLPSIQGQQQQQQRHLVDVPYSNGSAVRFGHRPALLDCGEMVNHHPILTVPPVILHQPQPQQHHHHHLPPSVGGGGGHGPPSVGLLSTPLLSAQQLQQHQHQIQQVMHQNRMPTPDQQYQAQHQQLLQHQHQQQQQQHVTALHYRPQF